MIFNYDSLKKDWGLGGMGKLPGILKGIFTGQKTEISKAVSNEISDVMRNAFDMLDPNELFMKQLSGSSLTDFVKDIGDSNFEKFIAQMDEATIKGMSAKEVFDSFANSTHNVTESVSMGSKVFSGLLHGVAALGAQLLTVVAVIGAITLAMKGFEAIYNNLPSVKRKHDIESGKAAQSAIQQINEEFENNEKSTEELSKRYNELRSGVTYQSGKGYTNTSLSTEEFEEFLNINNELVALYPQLRAGTDAQGNSYVDLGTDADKATQSLKELLAVQRDLANKEIGEKFSDQLAGVLAQNANASDKIAESDAVIAATQANIEARNKGVNQFIKKISNGEDNKGNVNEYAFTINQGEDYKGKVQEAFEKAFYMNGIDIGPGYSSGSILDEFGMPTATTITYTFTADITDLNEAVEEANKLLASTDGGEYDKSKDAENQRELSLREIRDNWETLKPTLLAQFSSTATYKDFSDTIQNGISSAIANIDMGAAYKTFEGQTEFDRFDDYLRNRLMYSLSNAVDRQNGEEAQKAMLKNIEELFTFDTSNLTDTEMTQQVNTMLDRIFLGDEELEHIFKVALKYEVVDEDTGDIEDMGTVNSKRRRRIYNIIGGKESGISLTELKKLTQEQQDAIIQASDNSAFNYKGSSLQELLDWIDKYKNKTDEIEKDGTLSSIFSDESYQSDAEGYEKKLSSLTGALETIRTEGTLSSEATRDLYEEFSNLAVEAEKKGGVLTEALISDAAKDELDTWIKNIRSRMEELTPEEQAGANRYIQSLVTSWGQVADSVQDVKELYLDLYSVEATNDQTAYERATDAKLFEQRINTLQEQLGDEELDMNIVYLMVARDEFSGTAEEIKQKYDNTQITYQVHVNEAEVEKAFQRSIERTNSEIAAWQAQNEKIVAENGQYALSPIDYESVVLGKQGNARTQRSRAEMYRTDYEKILGMEGVTNDELKQAYKNWMDAETDANNAEAEAFNSYKEQQESILNEANKKITDAQAEAAQAQSEIDDALAHGTHADQSVYDRLAKAQWDEAQGQRDLANGYRELANNPKLVGSRGDYLKSAAEAESAATESDKSARETGYQTELNSITDLQNAYTELQSSATNTENELNNADIKRQKTTEKLYDSLINNGRDQIDNLKQQKIHYENLRRAAELALDPESAREYQSEIDNIDSSISSMESNVLGWQDTMTSLISTNASELSSALSSAMSEMNSETGLTIDTMNELQRQFSDLAGYDVSNIFYESADGMKMNVGAAEELVDAEYRLQTTNLYDTIAQQKSIIEQYGNSEDEVAQQAVAAAETRINAAQRELAMLEALYSQQKEQFSQYQTWQNAQQTENAGARYEGLQGYLETAKKAYEQGMTGTDDFKEYVKYFDEFGEDTIAAYQRSIPKMERYLTEEYQGIKNFYDDLVTQGFGTEENGLYDIDLPSIEEAAKSLGISQEFFRDLMSRGEDYGFTNDWVGSELEGRLKIKDATQDLIDEQLRYNDAKRRGADDDVLEDSAKKMDTFSNSIHNLSDNIEDVVGREGKITSSQIQNAVDDINSLQTMIKDVKSDQAKGLIDETSASDQIDLINQNIKSYAEQHHIPYTVDINGDVQIDKEALDAKFDGWEEEIKVTPVLPTNEDIQGLELTGDQQTDSVIQGLQAASGATGEWDEEMQDLLNTINGYTGEDLDQIVFGDDKYQDQALEAALDSVLSKLGLGQEYGNALVEVLKQVLTLDGQSQGKVYDVNPDEYNQSTGTRVTSLKQELQAESIPYNIDFDTSIMNAEELKTKLQELKNIQRQNTQDPFLSDDASRELNSLISSTGKQYKIQVGIEAIQGQGMTLDQFLSLSQEEQKQLLVDVDMNDTEYEQFVQKVESQTIKSQIQTVISSGSTSLSELSSLSGDALQDRVVELGVDVTGLEDAQELEQIVAELQSESTTVNVRIAEDQMSALTSEDVEIGANTDSAKKAIENVEKRANDAEGEMTVSANTQPAISDVNSAIEFIDAQHPTLHVDADTNNLDSSIAMVLATPRTINVHANVTGLPGGGGGTISVDGINNGGFAFAGGTGTKDDKEIPLSHNNDTLVGEEGYEIHVDRDGRSWSVIGQNGPEFRNDINPGDIVFDHEQSVRLLKNGHTNKRGRALAGGTQNIGGMSRVTNNILPDSGGSSSNTKNDTQWNKQAYEATRNYTNAQQAATNSTNAATDAKDKETDATENATTALDKFSQYVGSLYDWIQVKISRWTQKMELAIKKAENIGGTGTTGYLAKNARINEAMADNGVLLDTNIRGEKRYKKQANKIANKAVSMGLLTKKQKKKYKGLIANGAISIEELEATFKKNTKGQDTSKSESKIKTFIDAYTEWYEKMLDCIDAQEECIAKNKELQQTKLDNITAEFESLASYADSVAQTSQAVLSLYNTRGGQVNGQEAKAQFTKQIGLQNQIAGYYSEEMAAFRNELQNAKAVFGENSNEYRAALQTYQEMETAFYNATQSAAELREEMLRLDLKPMDYAINRLKENGQALSGIVSLKEATGTLYGQEQQTRLTEENYTDQIENANDQMVQLILRRNKNQEILSTLNPDTDSDKYDQYKSDIAADNEAINQLKITIQGLKDSLVDLRWKPFEELQEQINNAKDDFDHLRGLINKNGLFDDDGNGWNFTEDGIANIALIGGQMESTEEQIKSYRQALNKLQEDYENNNMSEEKYKEKSRQLIETIQGLVDNTQNWRQELIDLYNTQIQNQNSALQENISLLRDASQAQREYYEYSKRLRDLQKNRNNLQSQVNALQGTTNKQAQAQLARLRDQLNSANEELADTRKSHRYDLISSGYDRLSDDANKSMQQTLDAVKSSSARQEVIVQQMLSTIKNDYEDAYNRIQQVINGTGTVITNMAENSIKVNGEVNQYIDAMAEKYANVQQVWQNYSSIVMASGQPMVEALSDFMTFIDTGTLKPSENWETFKSVVGQDIATEQFDIFCQVISLGIATETQEWESFRQNVESEINKQMLTDLFTYISDRTGESITNWDSFKSAVANGEFSQEQLKKIYDYILERTGQSFTDWDTFKTAVESGDITGTVVDDALDKVQQKIDGIKTSWGTVVNQMTGDTVTELTDNVQTPGDALDVAQSINTDRIEVNKTTNGKTPEQEAAEIEEQRKQEEATRLAAEEKQRVENQRAILQSAIAENTSYLQNANEDFIKANQNADEASMLAKNYYGYADYSKSIGHKKMAKQHKATADDYYNQSVYWRAQADTYHDHIGIYAGIIEDLEKQLASLPSYRSGAKNILKNELALTHDDEIILGNGAVLRQLPKGSQVLPKLQSDNIWKWSQIDPTKANTSVPNVSNVSSVNSGGNYYYDALIKINGNVDGDMLNKIDAIANNLLKDRNFMQKQFDYNTKELKREFNKRY